MKIEGLIRDVIQHSEDYKKNFRNNMMFSAATIASCTKEIYFSPFGQEVIIKHKNPFNSKTAFYQLPGALTGWYFDNLEAQDLEKKSSGGICHCLSKEEKKDFLERINIDFFEFRNFRQMAKTINKKQNQRHGKNKKKGGWQDLFGRDILGGAKRIIKAIIKGDLEKIIYFHPTYRYTCQSREYPENIENISYFSDFLYKKFDYRLINSNSLYRLKNISFVT